MYNLISKTLDIIENPKTAKWILIILGVLYAIGGVVMVLVDHFTLINMFMYQIIGTMTFFTSWVLTFVDTSKETE